MATSDYVHYAETFVGVKQIAQANKPVLERGGGEVDASAPSQRGQFFGCNQSVSI